MRVFGRLALKNQTDERFITVAENGKRNLKRQTGERHEYILVILQFRSRREVFTNHILIECF